MSEQDEFPTEEEIIAKCKLSPKTVKLLRDMSKETYKEIAREILFLAKPIILAKAKKQEGERIYKWGNEDCPHNHSIRLKIKRGCIACWQTLKERNGIKRV